MLAHSHQLVKYNQGNLLPFQVTIIGVLSPLPAPEHFQRPQWFVGLDYESELQPERKVRGS